MDDFIIHLRFLHIPTGKEYLVIKHLITGCYEIIDKCGTSKWINPNELYRFNTLGLRLVGRSNIYEENKNV